jgi:Trypsin-co-occurring domain 1
MSDVIGAETGRAVVPDPGPARRLVPLKVGEAMVFVEQVGDVALVEADDTITPVAPSLEEAFEHGLRFVRSCVSAFGEQLQALAEKTRPRELAVEFSLTFEAKGKAALIPVLVTGETGAQTGLKVTATWRND